jgi:ParB family chromosome partitioning protein
LSDSKFNLSGDMLLVNTQADLSEQQILPIGTLHPFKNHPFKMYSEDKMNELVESVKQHGILMPILVRPRSEGGYEIISGHNRAEAASIAGMDDIPANVREMDDDQAILAMVDSNLRQRETLLPSEKAWAYRMKIEALDRQLGRPPEKGGQVGHLFDGVKTRDIISKDAEDSSRQIQRYIRLTHLIEPLQNMVDLDEIGFTPAVELSYLKENEQITVVSVLESEEVPLSLAQAKKMKELSREDKLNDSIIEVMLMEEKPSQTKVTLRGNVLKKYFPENTTPKEMEETIIKLLENWQKKTLKEKANVKKTTDNIIQLSR